MYDKVARFIDGESIEVVVTETEKAVAARIYESDRHNGLLEAEGLSHARANIKVSPLRFELYS